jgi:hypothetical protein
MCLSVCSFDATLPCSLKFFLLSNETFIFKAAVKSRASPLSPGNSDAVQAVSSVRRSYETELEQVLEVKSYFY